MEYTNKRAIFFNQYTLTKRYIPILFERYFGIDQRYNIALNTPDTLFTNEVRNLVKEYDLDELKKLYYSDQFYIDDPIESHGKHTLIHDAVVMNREDLFDFLIAQKANLNIRDFVGYTPMLKAASLGRFDMVKKLVENGVDPRHIDPHGNTPRDKAILYSRFELIDYLKEVEDKANRGELKFIDWTNPERIRRSGMFLGFLEYNQYKSKS
ncbi:ankyrin repeat domain-containing protein 7-like [Stylonychia lemnae]|uniref:Ankyrin repeat domain-containing protein 7-like n=1 Tax=Stylonychia lemnae TaxID=5949 RepID=A0A078A9S2_STYLE|nr:ankyrin repeat domain-containing protein 7-like [Stylonychia lemnae]|eukprot:CDW77543.1 ankyrin repeat domain-containing protein 7-like [Stylonychia lemnae]